MAIDFLPALERLGPRLGHGPVQGLTRLSGGASQETWAFEVGVERFILRRAPGGVAIGASAQSIGLDKEAAVISAARAGGAPTPDVAHVCRPDDGMGLAYVMRRLEGETIARKILRDDRFAAARGVLSAQCGTALAQIHATPAPTLPDLPLADAAAQLTLYETAYRSFNAARPMFSLAFRELERRLPAPVAPVLVHGDFRLGNLMVDESGLVAALDWELAHRGDPAEDLGWITTPSWRFGVIDHPVGGFGAIDDLIAAYHQAGGSPAVDAPRVAFWTLFGALKWGIMCLIMVRAYESGMDKSVERAAIGRRASETELDLALMLKGLL
jgi:aminoglycoside phosphotransferase (APT) family kinase protein